MLNSSHRDGRRQRRGNFEQLETREMLAGDLPAALNSIRQAAVNLETKTAVVDTQTATPSNTASQVHTQAASTSTFKPRLLVLTDIGGGDPDDEQSLVRLLAYANEFRIEGLIAGASLQGTVGVNDAKIRNIINHYESVRGNLLRHDSGYPTASYLRSKVAAGQPRSGLFGAGNDTAGSNRIINAVDATSEPLNIAIWGGSVDLAQALWSVRNDRSQVQVDAFVSKLRVAWIEQGPADAWIKSNFPDMWVVSNLASGDSISQAPFRGMYLGGDTSLATTTWVQQNVKAHQPYGNPYPTNAAGAAMKEGDTPTWFYFLPSNLSNPDHPEWGGWGGRYQKNGSVYSPAKDNLGSGSYGRDTVSRWRLEFQNDFAARMDWTQASYDDANHNPVAAISTPNQFNVTSGQSISIDASSSWDPDGDKLSFEWFQYREAGSYPNSVALSNVNSARVQFQAPSVSTPQTIHIILKVRDNGAPNLFDYQRVIVTVRPSTSGSSQRIDTNTSSDSSIKILPLGDSITAAESPQRSYRDPLWQKLTQAGYDIDFVGSKTGPDSIGSQVDDDHEGHWGSRADQVLSGLLDRLRQSNPDVALLHVGTNDVFQRQSHSSTIEDIRDIVATLRHNNPDITILVSLLIPTNYASNEWISEFNQQLATQAGQWGTTRSPVILVDQNSAIDPARHLYDGVHPNADGEQIMADVWFQHLKQVIDGTTTPTPTPTPTTPTTPSTPTTSNGPVVELRFDEGTGTTTADSSGHGNHGQLVNTEATDWVTGESGRAIQLDSKDEYVRVRESSSWATRVTDVSVSAWVKLDDLSNINYKPLVIVGNWEDQRLNVYPVDGKLQFAASTTGYGLAVTSPRLPFLSQRDNQFHHIVAVKDELSQTASLYVDGVLVGTDEYASGNVDLRGRDLSFCGNSSSQIACSLDDATLHHEALSSSQVAQMYQAGKSGTPTPTNTGGTTTPANPASGAVVDLAFNEGSGTTSSDLSGHGNTGLLLNTENADWVDGIHGQAIQLDNDDERVRVRSSSSWASQQESFTLSTWVRMDELSDSNYKSIAIVGSWEDQRLNLYPLNGRLQFVADSSDWSTSVQSQWLPFLHTPDNRFHHIVAVKDNATHSASIYVDGVLVGTDEHASGSVDLRGWDLSFCGGAAGTRQIDCTLDGATLYHRALSSSEISQLYAANGQTVSLGSGTSGFGSTDSDAVVELDFAEGSGNTTRDLSGNGNTGIIYNTESSDWKTGSVTAIELDGQNEQVRVGPTSSWSKPLTDVSLSVWLKFDDPASSNYTSIASVGSWADQRLNLYRAEGRLHFVLNTDGENAGMSTQHYPFLWWPDNRYHHIVAIKDSSTGTASLYVDGKLAGTDEHTSGAVDLRGWDLTFGGNSAGNKMMPITLGSVKLFDRAISTTEVDQLGREFWDG